MKVFRCNNVVLTSVGDCAAPVASAKPAVDMAANSFGLEPFQSVRTRCHHKHSHAIFLYLTRTQGQSYTSGGRKETSARSGVGGWVGGQGVGGAEAEDYTTARPGQRRALRLYATESFLSHGPFGDVILFSGNKCTNQRSTYRPFLKKKHKRSHCRPKTQKFALCPYWNGRRDSTSRKHTIIGLNHSGPACHGTNNCDIFPLSPSQVSSPMSFFPECIPELFGDVVSTWYHHRHYRLTAAALPWLCGYLHVFRPRLWLGLAWLPPPEEREPAVQSINLSLKHAKDPAITASDSCAALVARSSAENLPPFSRSRGLFCRIPMATRHSIIRAPRLLPLWLCVSDAQRHTQRCSSRPASYCRAALPAKASAPEL